MEIFMNLVIISMLVVTIVYAYKLNGKLNVIRNHRAEIKTSIDSFYDATDKAIKAVDDLKKQGETICKIIDAKIGKAQLISDELDFLLTRANRKTMEMKETYVEAKKKVTSLAEADLIKALRDRQYREALVG